MKLAKGLQTFASFILDLLGVLSEKVFYGYTAVKLT